MDAANKTDSDFTAKLAQVSKELSESKSVLSKMQTLKIERENGELKETVKWYQSVIRKMGLEHLFTRADKQMYKENSR